MNRRFSKPLRPLSLALAAAVFTSQAHAQDQPTRVENQLLVRWASQSKPLVLAPGVNPARWQQSGLASQISTNLPGAKVTRTFAGSGWSLIKIPSGLAGDATKAQLAKKLGAANVTYNFTRKIATAKTPNDPEYSNQWQWPKVKAPEAWGLKTGGTNVVVAVLDSGIDLGQADIKANLWVNSKEIPNNNKDDDGNGYVDDVNGINSIDPTLQPQDDNGHGTHCAGLIGAVGNNKRSVTGACWITKIMALKFLGSNGTGDDADAIECLEYAVKMKKSGVNLRVISNSWSGEEDNPALLAAFQLAENAGILNVCAAGNGKSVIVNGVPSDKGRNIDTKPEYPASYKLDSIVSVAASDQSDTLASFSNFGAKSVDLAAPGTGIVSLSKDGGFRTDSGTSMATPIVAGAATLLAIREPALTAAQLKARLLGTVDPVAALKGKVVSGGRLNMSRTLTNATLKISGLVYRLQGTTKKGLAGAVIKVNSKTTTTSGKDGKYEINDLAPGTLQITATLKGFTFGITTVVMPQTGTASAPNAVVDLVSQTQASTLYTLSGYARNASGVGQKNISIFINGLAIPVAVTDSNGKYKITDRGTGSYKLTASGGNGAWKPDLETVSVPTKSGTTGYPNGIVNFTMTVPDTTAPRVVITTPANGATFTPGALTASGAASDPSGVAQVIFQLTHTENFSLLYYDWVKKVWTEDGDAAGVNFAQSVTGSPVSWTQTLPSLTAGTYTLRVRGKDTLGQVSDDESDASSTFTVASAVQSTQKATIKTGPSGGSF